jgi:tetratricopeptide (TPR) repeat protein
MPTPLELYNEAMRLKNEGELEQAVAKLHEALEVDNEYALAHSALAVVLQKLERHDEAIVHAECVCKLLPSDPFSYTALSVTYQRAYAGTGDMKYIPMAEQAMERSRMVQGH